MISRFSTALMGKLAIEIPNFSSAKSSLLLIRSTLDKLQFILSLSAANESNSCDFTVQLKLVLFISQRPCAHCSALSLRKYLLVDDEWWSDEFSAISTGGSLRRTDFLPLIQFLCLIFLLVSCFTAVIVWFVVRAFRL